MYFKEKLRFVEIGPDANGTLFINESVATIENYIKELQLFTPDLAAELKECEIRFPAGLYPLRFNTEHVCFAFGSYEIPLCGIDNFITGSINDYINCANNGNDNSLNSDDALSDTAQDIATICSNLLLPLAAYNELASHLNVNAFINLDNQLIVQDCYEKVASCLADYTRADSNDMAKFDIRFVDVEFPEIRIRNNGKHHYINLNQYETARIDILVKTSC